MTSNTNKFNNETASPKNKVDYAEKSYAEKSRREYISDAGLKSFLAEVKKESGSFDLNNFMTGFKKPPKIFDFYYSHLAEDRAGRPDRRALIDGNVVPYTSIGSPTGHSDSHYIGSGTIAVRHAIESSSYQSSRDPFMMEDLPKTSEPDSGFRHGIDPFCEL